MSEADYFEAQSDSFWEIGQYKRTIKRIDESHKLCTDLMQMMSERASLEKAYAKSLKSWSKKWNEYLDKGSEYGTMKSTWSALLGESNRLSEIHIKIHDDVEDGLMTNMKAWQKQNYQKTLMNQLKISKTYEEEFGKAQKPWAKKYMNGEKCKKEYHGACKQHQSAKVQEVNARNDVNLTQDQKKKYEEKVEKLRKEVESTKHKYEQSLDDINSYNSHYIEDMKSVYKKCDMFEKSRLDYFIEKFHQIHQILDLSKKEAITEIYADLVRTVRDASPDKDLLLWSKGNGAAMSMNWPVFEEYSEEFKTIARGSKASKITKEDDSGVTMTSIRQKEETSSISGLRSASNNGYGDSSKKSPQQPDQNANPFGDSDTEDAVTKSDDDDYSSHSKRNIDFEDSRKSNNNNNEKQLSVQVRAIYDYQSAEDDELSFKAGETFTKLMNEDERGWCLGQIGDKVGLFPATYVVDL